MSRVVTCCVCKVKENKVVEFSSFDVTCPVCDTSYHIECKDCKLLRHCSGHFFCGSYKSNNPCIICGTWEDEAFTLPGNCTL